MLQKCPTWLIFFVDVGVSIHLHTVEFRLIAEANNLVVILNQCYWHVSYPKSRKWGNTYVRIDGQQILIEVCVRRAVQENSVLYGMYASLSII